MRKESMFRIQQTRHPPACPGDPFIRSRKPPHGFPACAGNDDGRMHLCVTLAIILCLALSGMPVHADTPPVPPRKESLEQVEQRLAKEKQTHKILGKQLGDAGKQLEETRAALVATADAIRASEKTLQTLDKKMTALEREGNDITIKLEHDYGSISGLVLALERIRRVPPEALMVRPGAPLQAAQTAMLLKSVLPVIDRRAAELSRNLNRLNAIAKTMVTDREATRQARDTLAKKQDRMSNLLKTRETLYRRIHKDYDASAKNVQKLAEQAQSLHELFSSLEENKQRQEQQKGGEKKSSGWSLFSMFMPDDDDAPRDGEARFPVFGHVLVSYGQTDDIGAKSQGISIEAKPGALVTAPIGGTVRFAGTFKNYGQLVIIEHTHGYHSLVAGLARIDTVVGQSLDAGEPLGILPSSSSRGERPALYYELRHKGQPVDPAKKFPDIKS